MKQISLNLGAIKDTVYRCSAKTVISEGNIKVGIVENLAEKIKKSPILKVQYLIFKNLTEGFCTKDRFAERFILQNLSLLEDYSWNDLINANRELRISLLENFHVESEEENYVLYESIQTIIKAHMNKLMGDMEGIENAHEYVMEHLKKDKKLNLIEENDNPTLLSWDFVTKLAVNNFNKRYAHLSENEQDLLKVLLSDKNKKENYFKDLRNENNQIIDELLLEHDEKEIVDMLNGFKSKIISLDENKIDDSILHLFELKDELANF